MGVTGGMRGLSGGHMNSGFEDKKFWSQCVVFAKLNANFNQLKLKLS